MKNIIVLIGFVIVAAVIAAVSLVGIDKFALLKGEEVASQIRFECAQAYRYTETLPNGATVSYPMEKEYSDCVNSKLNLN